MQTAVTLKEDIECFLMKQTYEYFRFFNDNVKEWNTRPFSEEFLDEVREAFNNMKLWESHARIEIPALLSKDNIPVVFIF